MLLGDKHPDFFPQIIGKKECAVMDRRTQEEYNTTMIYMEMMIGDLRQFIHDRITIDNLNKYIIDVYESLSLMAKEGYVHGDLHIGNIFIKNTNGKMYAVIGDFGKSYKAEYLSSPIND